MAAAQQRLVYLRSDVRGLKTAVLNSSSLRDLRRKITALAGKNTGAVTLFRWDADAQSRGELLSEDDMDLLLVDLGIMGTSVFVAQGAGARGVCLAEGGLVDRVTRNARRPSPVPPSALPRPMPQPRMTAAALQAMRTAAAKDKVRGVGRGQQLAQPP